MDEKRPKWLRLIQCPCCGALLDRNQEEWNLGSRVLEVHPDDFFKLKSAAARMRRIRDRESA